MLNWANQFNIFCLLDNQAYAANPHSYEYLLAAGVKDSIESNEVQLIDSFLEEKRDWVFGHLSYDLKNSIHHFSIEKENKIGFPHFYFFKPQNILLLKEDELTISSADPDLIYQQIQHKKISERSIISKIAIQQNFNKEKYIQKIVNLQKHILRGDCYEINFCQEFFAENTVINPAEIFENLMAVSPNPFSAFYKVNDKYLICSSPERFLCRQKTKIISQPIKGTIKRDLLNKKNDEALKNELKESGKDKAENVMIVDLVRNDLSRICKTDSVKVEELFGVYSFPQVHQMISTISGEIKDDLKFSEIIDATFPMGSMTGAPKQQVMEFIDEYEMQSRGIFSGSVGYISPDGDFDFNVVIRSIMYNATNKYLSYQVGSGITFYSDPEKEWEECLLKAEGIRKVLEG